MANAVDGLELMITTMAAASAPVITYYFRGRRTRKPKNSSEKLYAYYENYIDRLEKQLAKKDTIIYAQDQQLKEQASLISQLQSQQEASQQEIKKLKDEVIEMQTSTSEAHRHIDTLKKKALEEK